MEPDEAAIAAGAKALAAGRLVAFPTETVYGLGANALDPDAVAAIFAAKGRPTDHPLICHVASADALAPLVAAVTPAARALGSSVTGAARRWPRARPQGRTGGGSGPPVRASPPSPRR